MLFGQTLNKQLSSNAKHVNFYIWFLNLYGNVILYLLYGILSHCCQQEIVDYYTTTQWEEVSV